MNNSDSPVVFCHNDLHQGNILLPEESQDRCKDVVFIDYEYSSYNYRAFDIANHFNEWMFDYAVTSSPGFVVCREHFPDESRQKLFLSGYLKELHWPVSGESLQALYAEVAGFVPVTNFFWAVWGLLQFEISPIDFDFLEFAKVRFHLYFKNRRAISSYLKEVYQVGVDEPGINRVIESEPIAT